MYERRHRGEVKNLSEIGPGKQKLVTLFYGYVQAMQEDPDRFRDEAARRYVPITRVEPTSQILIVEAEPGFYGLGGSTRDAMTHEKQRDHEPGDSPGTPVRLLLAQAPDANTALMFVERVGGSSAGSDLMEGFEDAFKAQFADLNIDFEPMIESSAWLATAALDRVTVVDRNYSRDVGEGDTETKVIGTIEHVLKPPQGVRTFTRRLLAGLTNGSILPEQLVNLAFDDAAEDDLPDNVETESATGKPGSDNRTVKVRVVGEDGKSKTYVLGRPRTPSVAYDFGDHGSQPSDPIFRDACVALIPDLIGEQAEWKDEYHQTSTWPRETLNFRMELPPHGP
ncbi:MAG TPA: hypothetical protein VK816_09230 [Jatrophihabitantaceae bacterium]|nr:hypothetical protein [Jatrophihabitantaceae bacterium]